MGVIEALVEQTTPGGLAFVALAVLVGYVVIFRIWRWQRLRRLGARAPRVTRRWTFGADFVYFAVRATRMHRNLDMWLEWFRRAGRYTAEATIVDKRIVFTAEPENIKAVLATQFADFGKGETFHDEWRDFLGDSIFVTDGDMWHASRQLLRPQFVRDRVSDLHCFEEHVQTLLRTIANGGPLNGENQLGVPDLERMDGTELEISDLFFRYTLDVATDFLLGKDVKSMTTPRQEFAEAFNEVQRIQSMGTRAGPFRHLIPKGSFRRGLAVINAFVTQYVDLALQLSQEELESKSKTETGYTFLHELASFTRDPAVLRDQLVAVLLAGRDTTAATLSWTLYELGRNPAVVRRLRREILDTVGPDRPPTYADLKGMRYLQHAMSETLRLYPVIPFNVRVALRDTTIPVGGGPDGRAPVAVLKGEQVGYSTLIMQRRADLYPPSTPASSSSGAFPDPAVFAPERWDSWQPRPWDYVPFNGGPRICIGQQFALTEMSYVLCRLFQRFDRVENRMGPVDGGHPCLKAEIVLQPGQGVKVAFWTAKNDPKESG